MTKKYFSDEIYSKILDSSDGSASDLLIKTGAEKTVVIETPVYKDIPMAFSLRGSGGEATVETIIGNIKGFRFDTNEVIYINNVEAPHDYKYGTGIEIHLHWLVKKAMVAGAKVKWQFEFAIGNVRNGVNDMTILCDPANPTVFGTKTISVEYETPVGGIPAGTVLNSTIGVVSAESMANVRIGCSMIGVLSRVAKSTGGTDPSSDTVYAMNMGIHYQLDTLGSRTMTVK
jgi:hypothetical protein